MIALPALSALIHISIITDEAVAAGGSVVSGHGHRSAR
jgi:hypothetical protein